MPRLAGAPTESAPRPESGLRERWPEEPATTPKKHGPSLGRVPGPRTAKKVLG